MFLLKQDIVEVYPPADGFRAAAEQDMLLRQLSFEFGDQANASNCNLLPRGEPIERKTSLIGITPLG